MLAVLSPVGLVYDEKGWVCLHPDAQVRQSIHLLFETFRRTGTAGATVKYFGDKSLLFPRPAGPGSHTQEVVWSPLDLPTVVRILHNPRYAGAFVYGRRRTERRPGGGSQTMKLPREKWHTLLRDAHPGYVEWDEFERNEQTLKRSAMAYGLDNRLVATTLEADWNDNLRALAQARDEAERQRAADQATFDEATEARVRALAQDFPAVWNDSSTSHRDKKRMAQMLIEDVTLLKTDQLHVHIRFKGGALESLALPLPKNAWHKRLTHPDVVARIEQLIKQYDEAEVAERLNAEGLLTGAGRPFDQPAVRWVRYNHGLKTPSELIRETGKLTSRQIAARLGLSHHTVRNWARNGRLRAERHGSKPVWLFDPIEEQPESIRQLAARRAQAATDRPQRRHSTPPQLRARIDELLRDGCQDAEVAERLNAQGWSRPAGASFDAPSVCTIRTSYGLLTLWERLRQAGKLTAPEIAVRPGIGLKTVGTWARARRLRGQRCGNGIRARWLFDPIDEQPETIRQRAAKCATLGVRGSLLSDAAAGRGAV